MEVLSFQFSLLIRLASFVSFASILLFSFLPFTARICLFFSLSIFLLNPSSAQYLSFIAQPFEAFSVLSLSENILEISYGMILAVVLAAAAFCAELLLSFIFASSGFKVKTEALGVAAIYPLLRNIFLLFICFELLRLFQADSFALLAFFKPLAAALSQENITAIQFARYLGKVFSTSFLLALPFFFFSISLDILIGVANRLGASVVQPGLLSTSKLVVAVLFLSFSLATYLYAVRSFWGESALVELLPKLSVLLLGAS